MKPINITSNRSKIELLAGLYSVRIVGGWKVKTNNFHFVIKELRTGLEIESKKTSWGIQSYVLGKKAKKIGSISIPRSSTYEIELFNVDQLQVKPYNHPLINYFQNYLPKDQIEFFIG
jgi:hypothetical protein